MLDKVGLALGGGAARGYAHIGVLKVLERERIPVDLIAGASMGSMVGAYYACGYRPSELEDIAMATKRRHIVSPGYSKMALLSNRKIVRMLDSHIGNRTFEDLEIPLSVVTMDILTGDEVIINTGLVKEAVLTSISVPGVFPPRETDGKILLDGGPIDQVPVGVVRNMGAHRVIAVDIGFLAKKREKYKNAIHIITRALDIMEVCRS